MADSSAIYLAAPESQTGKSTIALGLLHRLTAMVAKVGVFRPITRLSAERDYILELLLAHTSAGLPYERCVGVTYQQLHADRDDAIAEIVDSYHAMADECDAVVVVGSDYTDVTSPTELSVNARIAVNLGAPVLLTVRAKDRTPDQVASVVEVCLAELDTQRAHTAAVVANRCELSAIPAVTDALRRFTPPSYVVPEEPLLSAPTVAELHDQFADQYAQWSGMLGLAGERDFRRLRLVIETGDRSAQLAYEVFIHRLRKYLGAYLAVLGHTDVVSFTAGIGENDAAVRRDALAGLQGLGIALDQDRNLGPGHGARRISSDDSPIAVLVVPTNEELAIARDCLRVLGGRRA